MMEKKQKFIQNLHDTICNNSHDTYKLVQVKRDQLEILARQYKVPRTTVPEMRRNIAILMKLDNIFYNNNEIQAEELD